MINVCLLQHGLGYGGATKSLILLQESIKDHCKIYTFSLPIKKHPEIKDLFVNSIFIKEVFISTIYSHSFSTSPISKIKNTNSHNLDDFIFELALLNVDILHINSTLFSHILKPIKTKLPNLKIVVHLRESLPFGPSHPVDRYIIENTLLYSDKILAITSNEANYFDGEKKLEILPNPHNFSETDKYLGKEKNDKITIGMIAGFLPYKGHMNFIEAANLVIEKLGVDNTKLEFVIIGYPKQDYSLMGFIKNIFFYRFKKKFDKRIRSTAINDYVKIIPYTFDIYEKLSNFDVYVRPDSFGQPWGRDIIEAMALGIPVIATGHSEFYIEDGITGHLVQPNNSLMLSNRIIDVITNPKKKNEMGKAGYIKIKHLCNINNYGKKIVTFYKEILGDL
jgi:glycosyltransferase involved in cell wall biosynthesis